MTQIKVKISRFSSFLFILAIFVSSSNLVFAATEHGSEHAPSILDTKYFWFNFVIYVLLLGYLLKPIIRNGWSQRRNSIESLVTRGQAELDAARNKLMEAERRLALVADEIKGVGVKIAAEAQQEANLIVAEAKKRAERIVAQAKSLAEAERRAAELALKRALAERVIDQARVRLMNEITSESDSRFRDAALSGLNNLIH